MILLYILLKLSRNSNNNNLFILLSREPKILHNLRSFIQEIVLYPGYGGGGSKYDEYNALGSACDEDGK